MTGREIYEMYKKKRDYSGSPDDRYAQSLRNIFFSANFDKDLLFELVKKAEEANKKIAIKNYPKGILSNEITYDMLILV